MVGTAAATSAALRAISTPRGRADVVADHAPAGGGEIAGERAAHDAEADDADGILALLARRLGRHVKFLPR
jgi:hypothetical protein